MNIGQYKSQIREIAVILRDNNILANHVRDNLYNSKKAKEASKNKEYARIHAEVYNSGEYTFQLKDGSLFQFSFNQTPLILNYCYIPFPYEVITYEEYLGLLGFDFEEVGEGLREEYNQEISSANLKSNLLLIRYDYSEKEYTEKIHSVSHIHLGFNDVRITSEKIINPVTFFMFVLKQMYLPLWKSLIRNSVFCAYYEKYKNSCNNIPSSYFTHSDKQELYLN